MSSIAPLGRGHLNINKPLTNQPSSISVAQETIQNNEGNNNYSPSASTSTLSPVNQADLPNRLISPNIFTYSQHHISSSGNNNLDVRKPLITYQDLENHLGHSPTPNEVFNWVEERNLNHKITDEEVNAHLWADDVLQCLGLNKGVDISLDQLCLRLSNPTWQEHLNSNKRRPLNHPISLDELNEYLRKFHFRDSTLQDRMNWVEGHDLNHSFNEEATLCHPWDQHVSLCLGRDPDTFVQKIELEEAMGRTVNWIEHLNCNLNRPLNDAIYFEELNEYFLVFHQRNPNLQDVWELMNYHLGRDLSHPISKSEEMDFRLQNESPQEYYQFLFKKTPIKEEEIAQLTEYLERKPTIPETINWWMNRSLKTPITHQERIDYYKQLPVAALLSQPIDNTRNN